MAEKKRRAAPVRDRLDVWDIIRRVEQGETYPEIAGALMCSTDTIYRAIEAAGEDAISAHARAREASAEAWLDRGLAVVESALSKTGDVDASAARAYAQECARRAGIRNRAYRERAEVEHSGTVGQVHYVAELPRVAGTVTEWAQIVGGEVLPAPK